MGALAHSSSRRRCNSRATFCKPRVAIGWKVVESCGQIWRMTLHDSMDWLKGNGNSGFCHAYVVFLCVSEVWALLKHSWDWEWWCLDAVFRRWIKYKWAIFNSYMSNYQWVHILFVEIWSTTMIVESAGGTLGSKKHIFNLRRTEFRTNWTTEWEELKHLHKCSLDLVGLCRWDWKS